MWEEEDELLSNKAKRCGFTGTANVLSSLAVSID
jgi:hypothetical protein